MSKTSTAASTDSLGDDEALDNLLPPPKRRKPQLPEQPEQATAPQAAAPDAPTPEVPEPDAEDQPEPDAEDQVEAPAQSSSEPAAEEPAAPEEEKTPAPEQEQEKKPVRAARTRRAPARPASLEIQRIHVSADTSTQCTVNVSVPVRARFSEYQLAKQLEVGAEPTNAVVVRRAVLHARKHDLFDRMLQAVRQQQHASAEAEDDDPDDLFGDVVGRRTERGRIRQVAQLPFRPSLRELAVIDAHVRAYGFANRSEFLNAALDEFLPHIRHIS